MTRNLLRAGALACALMTSTCLTVPALAQSQPEFRNLDANGVDLTRGDHVLGFTEAVVGSGSAALALERVRMGTTAHTAWDGISLRRTVSNGVTTLSLWEPTTSRNYTGTGSSFEPVNADGSVIVGSGNSYVHIARDGTETEFGDPSLQLGGDSSFCSAETPENQTCELVPLSITGPDGKTVTLHYTLHSQQLNDTFPPELDHFHRLAKVSNAFGYAIEFGYATDEAPTNGPPSSDWYRRTGASLRNEALSNPIVGTVSYAQVNSTTLDVTNMAGETWRVSGPGSILAIRAPGATSDLISVSYANGSVSSVTRNGVTTNYARSVSGNLATMTVTNGLNQQTTIVSDLTIGRPTEVTDATSRTTTFDYDAERRLERITQEEGNYTQLTYDARGNVTQARQVSKDGLGVDDIVTSATYPSTCSNPVSCNQPETTTDALGNVTDYDYDPTTGRVTAVTAPAPTTGAVQPQIRYGYTNGLLTSISTCQTTASCAGAADEVRTVIGYDLRGNVTSVTNRAGDNSLTATTTMTYNDEGDLLTVDGPLTDDVTTYRYDAARRLVGVISPDPDGSADTLPRRAVRMTYRSDGQVSAQEAGTVAGTSDTQWAAFDAAQRVEAEFDAGGRPVVQRLIAEGTTYALTQTGYDAAGRVRCIAQRMNMAEFATASLPTDVCALDTEGTYGPDRITRYTFDAAGRTLKVESGVNSPAAADEMVATYTPNGQVHTLKDGLSNLTTYEYDAHDRLRRTYFPSPTQGAGTSSTTDYEQLTYDDAGNVTARQLRGTNPVQTITYAYDDLHRLISKDLPSTEPTVTYGYDLLGRLTSASQPGHALSFTYDALGRQLTEAGPNGTVQRSYDAAGRLTQLVHPAGPVTGSGQAPSVSYDYLVTDEMKAIREGSSTSPVLSFAYDGLGRRTGITRSNGASTSYGYDDAGRLDSLGQNPAGTGYDLTLSFDYNPAGQIVSAERTNNHYSITGFANQDVADTHNGLNQVTQTGTTTVTHDARGNVSAIGSNSYAYSSENRLTAATVNGSTTTYAYDPLGRLVSTSGGLRFAYDGDRLIDEYNGAGVLVQGYAHGPGVDEPVVRYPYGTATSRTFLHADERGSIVGATDNANGTLVNTNVFDEYGRTGPWNYGRFQYTGQAWLPEAGLFYYEARMYNPTLGRFMQTDPIGYADGVNLYSYVSGDPVNLIDPTGLDDTGNCIGGQTAGGVVVCGRRGDNDDLVVGLIRIISNIHGNVATGGQGFEAPHEVITVTCDRECQIAKIGRPARQTWGDWFFRRQRRDITGTSYCWKACGPNGLNPYPTYSPADQTATAVATGVLAGGAVAAPAAVSVEGASVGYARHGIGRAFQVRFFTDRLILRLDVRKPITHLNVQGRTSQGTFNYHIPRF